jgi:uncharacterized protein YdeI (BOF family)
MKLEKLTLLLALAAAGPFLAAPAAAGSPRTEDPYSKQDESWISLSGEVESVARDSFVLDYRKGKVTVEMDDDDRDAEAYVLLRGDRVTVFGFVDADIFQERTIEASSVYVDEIGTWFYASGVDEEDRGLFASVTSPVEPGRVSRAWTDACAVV